MKGRGSEPHYQEDFHKAKNKVQTLSYDALLLALSLAFSYFESFLPSPAGPFPLRYGLANIPLMFALLTRGLPLGVGLVLFKAGFALVTRGSLAALLSLGGGLVSCLLMYAADRWTKGRISFFLFSVLGSLSHNAAQLAVLTLLFPGDVARALWQLLPLLLILGLVSGLLTAFILWMVWHYLPPSYRAMPMR